MIRSQRLLEYLLVLALFLPVTFGAIFKSNFNELGDVTLRWGLIVSFLILSFLLLELFGEKINLLFEKLIEYGILINILSYAVVLILLGIKPPGPFQGFVLHVYRDFLIFLYIIPAVILFIIIVGILLNIYKHLYKMIILKNE